MKLIMTRDFLIGGDKTTVIVPIFGADNEEILEQADDLVGRELDLIEFRVDHCEDFSDIDELGELIVEIQEITKLPVMVTFRSKREGGASDLSDQEIYEVMSELVQSYNFTAIDIELDFAYRKELLKLARENGKLIIMSKHDFEKTPGIADMVDLLWSMDKAGADVCKLAVMPHSKCDVIDLMYATLQADQLIKAPIISMSMGELGKVTRLTGASFASKATFASNGKASAPGQVELEKVNQVIEILK